MTPEQKAAAAAAWGDYRRRHAAESELAQLRATVARVRAEVAGLPSYSILAVARIRAALEG